MNTVNVVEYFSDTIQALHAFPDTDEGNKEAEALFTKIAVEDGFAAHDIEVGMEDGTLCRADYELYIIHST